MAASAFKVFRQAMKGLGEANVTLSGGVYRLCLIKSGATMLSAASSASTWASLKTDGVTELSAVGGYTASGKSLAGRVWSLFTDKVRLDFTDFSLSASADLLSLRACVIRESAGDQIICYASLSSAAFAVSSGNKLTIQFNASGVFYLS